MYFAYRTSPMSGRSWLFASLPLYVWLQTMILMWLVRMEGYRFVKTSPVCQPSSRTSEMSDTTISSTSTVE
jgi:hypothetical protein